MIGRLRGTGTTGAAPEIAGGKAERGYTVIDPATRSSARFLRPIRRRTAAMTTTTAPAGTNSVTTERTALYRSRSISTVWDRVHVACDARSDIHGAYSVFRLQFLRL